MGQSEPQVKVEKEDVEKHMRLMLIGEYGEKALVFQCPECLVECALGDDLFYYQQFLCEYCEKEYIVSKSLVNEVLMESGIK